MPIGIVEVGTVQYVQNTSGAQLTIPDLGPKGCYLDVDEAVDLLAFFTAEEIKKSRDLARGIKSGALQQIDSLKDKKLVKTKFKWEGLPTSMETPAVDGENIYDQKRKELVEKEKLEDEETKASNR